MYLVEQCANYCNIYIHRKDQVSKKKVYESFPHLAATTLRHEPLPWEELIFLLDEQYFGFYRFKILLSSKIPFSITELKSLIQEKISYIKDKDRINSPIVTHHIDDIIVDKEPKDFLLGQTGTISFNLQIVVLKQRWTELCRLLAGERTFALPNLRVYPKSLFTLAYIKKQAKQKDYALLSIEEEQTQCIIAQQWRYQHVQYLNMGNHLLKSCYKEHDVEKYFYTQREDILENSFLTKLVDEAIGFFTNNLCQWLQQYITWTTNLIILGDITRNPSFLPVFKDSYHALSTWFIIPLSAPQQKHMSYTFQSEEMHIACYLETNKG